MFDTFGLGILDYLFVIKKIKSKKRILVYKVHIEERDSRKKDRAPIPSPS
jgi:hypothetical protein